MTGSRGQIAVRTADSGLVLDAIDADLRRFRFRRRGPSAELSPADVVGARGAEVREAMLTVHGAWTRLAVEDLESLYATAWGIHKATGVPVIAARVFQYGTWQFKAYADNDLVLKVGEGPDTELAWVGRPLDSERLATVVQSLGGGDALLRFCRGVIRGEPEPSDLAAALGGPSPELDFRSLIGAPGWQYVAWAQASRV